MIERIQAKRLGPYQLMIRDGEEEWRPALSFDEFRQHLLNVPTMREPSQAWVVLKRQDAGGYLAIESLGPFTSEEVREQIQTGRVDYTDYVWKDGMHQWRRISSLKEFSPFEKPVATPKPLVEMPPAPQIAKQVTREEALKKVEVVQRAPESPKPEPPPKEASGPDLTKPVLPPPPPTDAPAPKKKPTVVVKGSPAGIERRRLPRTAYVSVKARPTPTSEDPALEKTVVVEAKRPVERPHVKEEKEKTKTGIIDETPKDSVVTRVSEIYNARITLPRNWKQILIVLVLLGALYIKLFGTSDTIPLSQIPPLPTPEVAPPPSPPQGPPAVETLPQTAPTPDPSSMNDDQENEPEADPNAPGDEAIRHAPAPPPEPVVVKPPKKKPHEATKLRAHMLVQTDGGASLQIDTDASPNQTVTIEIYANAGQVLDRSHFYRKAKWTPGKPINLGGELPSGYYHLHASVGNLNADEKFEIGTHVKGFNDRLKQSRKQSAYEFWNERKRLYSMAQQLSHLVGSRHSAEFEKMSHFQASSYAFSDLWTQLKDVCQLAKKLDPTAKSRLQSLQTKIASLSVWK